jgi:hypothetical protein
VVITVIACDDLLDLTPGRLTVTNTGSQNTAVIAVLLDDVKSYPTLGPGASASVGTYVGGTYQIRVVMTPEQAQVYRDDLLALRRLLEIQVDGTASAEEKVQAFVALAGVKASLAAMQASGAAGCSGRIDPGGTVAASVAWVSRSGAGFWDVSCGS